MLTANTPTVQQFNNSTKLKHGSFESRQPHLPQKSASDDAIQGLSKGGTTSSSARLVSTAAGPFIRKLMKLASPRPTASTYG
jgi:hypothetical protein